MKHMAHAEQTVIHPYPTRGSSGGQPQRRLQSNTLLVCFACVSVLVTFFTTGNAEEHAWAPASSGELRYCVYGRERLLNHGSWGEYGGCQFSPATQGNNATLEFPSGKWTSLISTLPLDKKLGGTFHMQLRCRWLTDPDKHCSLGIVFMDASKASLKDGRKDQQIRLGAEWQDIEVEMEIPERASSVRFDIACHGGGKLEIEDYELHLGGVDLSEAAIKGVNMPWLKVPGGNLRTVGDEIAVARFAPLVPFACDHPLWDELPQYTISATSCNKTPLNGVSASFQLIWNDDAIFVKFRAHDKTLNFKHHTRYERDCFEFFLMPYGSFMEPGSGGKSKEQYTVTREENGDTSSNTAAVSRLVPDGWEAVIKIPLRTEARRIYPFNGLALTFNAAYQDANTIGQEHWLSFSPHDQTNSSWCKPELYVPLVFQADATIAYHPLWLGDNSEYNVDAVYPGRFNLIRNDINMDNISFLGGHYPEAIIDVCHDGDQRCFRVKFGDNPQQPKLMMNFTPFNVLPGETIKWEMEAKADTGEALPPPGLFFLSQANWQGIRNPSIDSTASDNNNRLTSEWIKYVYTLKVPENFRENTRNGRMVLDFKALDATKTFEYAGRTVMFRDLKVTRMLPTDFDALISTPGYYSHFWRDESNTIQCRFSSAKAVKVQAEVAILDYFTGKVLLSQAWDLDVPAEEENNLDWDVSSLPNGFFNVILKARTADGGFLADRELYISKGTKAPQVCPYSGIFIHTTTDLVPPLNFPEMTTALKNAGIGQANWCELILFDSRGNETLGDPLAIVKAFKQAGFHTSSIIRRGSHSIGREWQPDELAAFYEKCFTKTKGLIDSWSFDNESNLGWSPDPDGREWAVFNRGFYSALKKHTPGAEAIFGAFNLIPEEFITQAAQQNKHGFSDKVIGVHMYGVEVNGEGYKHVLESRNMLDRLYPGWEVRDTESGLVFYDFRKLLELQSKKMPLLLCAGITKSYFYQDRDILFPCSDATPLLPMESFKNTFYIDSLPVGRVVFDGGKVHVYLFRRANGQGTAAFWNISDENATIDLPGVSRGELYDIFGNSYATILQGQNSISLPDRFIRYVTGIDLAALMRNATFIPAFSASQDHPAADNRYVSDIYLSLPVTTKVFDQEIPVGKPSELVVSVHNEGASSRKIKLACDGPDGFLAEFDPQGEFLLDPQQSRMVSIRISTVRELEKQPFVISGTKDDGGLIIPLGFTVKTTPPIDVNGYTRMIELKNNLGSTCEVKIMPTKKNCLFLPGTITKVLSPAATAIEPITINPKGKKEDLYFNVPVYYSLRVTWPQGQYDKDGSFILFAPQKNGGSEIDFAHLPYSALPETPGTEPFKAEYRLDWTSDGLRITARVQDNSPVQERTNAELKHGGDCLLVAFDLTGGIESERSVGNYLECGYALSKQSPTAYAWRGKFGLETATDFIESVKSIHRDDFYLYYDIVIPQKNMFPIKCNKPVGMSMVFINKGLDGKSHVIELGQGILPNRNHLKMGLLVGDASEASE